MLAAIAAVFGFLAPFLPEVLKLFTRAQDNRHELELMKLRMAAAAEASLHRISELNAQADVEEAKVLHRPARSFGVQLIDAAEGRYPAWVMVPAFWLFALLDFLAGMVRPLITYAAVLFYMLVKYSRFELMQSVVSDDTRWFDLVARTWSEDDMAVLTLVLSYWFGNRVAKYAFGWDNKR
jgi:hypothetical protein